MRAALIVVLLALVVVVAWSIGGDGPGLGPGPADAAADHTAPVAAAAAAGVAPTAQPTVQSSTALRQPVDLASSPTACLRVVDRDTGQPIDGAAVYRMRAEGEAALGYSGADGLVPLALSRPGQLVVASRGYLLRLAPTRLGTSAAEPQSVALLADRYSARVTLQFRQPDGAAPDEVFVLLQPLRADRRDQPAPPAVQAADDDIRRAWSEQLTLAAVRPLPELHVQLGFANAAFVHQLADEDEVRFVEAGPYELVAATAAGWVARLPLDVVAGVGRFETVSLQRGEVLHGTAQAQGGGPVPDVRVQVLAGDPLQLLGRTDAAGRFALGPLAPGDYDVEFHHREFAAAAEKVHLPAPELTLRLQPLPADALRGRVVAAGTEQPLAGAVASVVDQLGETTTATADADGWFALQIAGANASKLVVSARGYWQHVELLGSTPGEVEFALWPANPDLRLQRGLTSAISGVVVDAGGVGVAGLGVRFTADAPPTPPGGRRVLQGGSLALPLATTTGADGSFALEVPGGASGAVSTVGNDPASATVAVRAGATTGGLRLQVRRR